METSATKYELTVVTQSEDAASVKACVAKNGAKVLNERPAAKIQLAYKIAKQGYGFSTTLDIAAEGAAIAEIKKELELDGDVLRAMVVKAKEVKEERGSKRGPKAADGAVAKIKGAPGAMLSNEEIGKKIEEISN